MKILAIDPGDCFVGVALYDAGAVTAEEVAAADWLPRFAGLVESLDQVVVEEFRLYPGSAPALSWSPMRTVEMIGVIRWLCSCAGVPITLQSAAVKVPTRQQAKARGITWKHKSGHASDAMLHLIYYALRHDINI
jgi:hypothetical protein